MFGIAIKYAAPEIVRELDRDPASKMFVAVRGVAIG